MQIKQKFIPTSKTATRSGIAMKPVYITIHETDNTNKGAHAAAHANLQYSGNSRTASWHYTVDDTEIWQSLPDNEVGWACGDGSNGTGNRKSISIELCVNSGGNFTKTKQNAAQLVTYLMKKHSIPISNVVQHNRWSGKNCPRNLRKAGWATFINEIKTLAGSGGSSVSTGNSSVIGRGDSGAAVTKIQQALNAKGFNVGAVDGDYGPKTQAAVKAFQKSIGLVVDGLVGPLTSAKLFAATPAKEYEFYDVVVNDEAKATFSARYKDDIHVQLDKLIDKQVDVITFRKRKK